jgi:hypothetical protein
MTTTQLQSLGNLFSEKHTTTHYYDGYRIVIEEFANEFEYEIFDASDPVGWDHGFESEGEARQAAITYINNL